MSNFSQAQKQLDLVEQAIHAGNLLQAASAVEALKPLLISDHIEELRQLRQRVDDLTINVRRTRGGLQQALRQKQHASRALDQYLATGNLTPKSQ